MNIASLYTSSMQQQSAVYTPRDRLMVGRDIAALSEPVAERKKTDTLEISDVSREAFFSGQHKQQRIEEYAFDGLTMSFENAPATEKDSLAQGARMLVLKEGGREVARLATQLGIEIQGDGGLLFYLAIAVFVCCAGVVWLHREQLNTLFQRIFKKQF